MLKKIVSLLRGSVFVRVESVWPERVLNLCSARGIRLQQMRWLSPTGLSFGVTRQDFAAFRRAIDKTDAAWQLERKSGAPYFLGRFRRRTALLFGLGALAALLIVNSLFIWDFTVTGNETVPEEKILRVLAENGVRRGTFAYSFRAQELCNHCLLKLPELSWLTVNVRGCRGYVLVRERGKTPQIVNERTPTNVVAKCDALVTQVRALDGEAKVQRGSVVQKGQLLIAGVVETGGAEKPGIDTRFLAGKGEVYGRTWYELIAKIPLQCAIKTYTGEETKRHALCWGEKRVKFYANDSSNIGANCDKIIHQTKWTLFGALALPVTWETETALAYETQTLRRTREEAEAIGKEVLETYLRSLLGEKDRVTVVRFASAPEGDLLRVTMSAECLRQIGAEVAIPVNE